MKTKTENKYAGFPKKFQERIGTEVEYGINGKPTVRGFIDDMRWSSAQIVNMKKLSERWYGIELRIKPNNGKRAFWTTAFNSGIKVKRTEV